MAPDHNLQQHSPLQSFLFTSSKFNHTALVCGPCGKRTNRA